MRRTDRLYDLIQILRDGRLHRAGEMARTLAVSERTIWRDMATLTASGMPLEGERGVGYILRSPITLPPMILSAVELAALRAGLRHVADGPDAALARAARGIAAKVAAVTPVLGTDDPLDTPTRDTARAAPHMPILRAAIAGREDAATPLAQSEDIARGIVGSTLVIIEACGHLSTLEKPAEVTRALRAWLEK